MSRVKTLHLFDFDGTVVFTPHKTTETDGVTAIERYDRWLVENNKPKRKWSGWWGRTETLQPPIFGEFSGDDLVPPKDLLNEELSDVIRGAMSEEDSYLILMTGRHTGMIDKSSKKHAVQVILDAYGLIFNEYHYFPGGKYRDTLSWKIEEIGNLRKKFSPEILNIYEDRPGHAYAFLREFADANIRVVNQGTRESYSIR